MSNISAFLRYGLAKTARKIWSKVDASAHLIFHGATEDKDIADARSVGSRYGVVMAANWSDKTFRYCIHGTYGHDLSDYLAAIDEDFIFLDIGSNQGLYAILAAKNARCRKVLAFEPVDRTYRLLCRNIQLNRQQDKIVAVQRAISSSAGSASIVISASHSGTASLVTGRVENGGVAQNIQTISVVELDEMIPPTHPIVIKIDVEGFEEVVLDELVRSCNLPRIASIFYEVDERWTSGPVMEARLRAAGFDRFVKFGRGHHYDVLACRTTFPLRA